MAKGRIYRRIEIRKAAPGDAALFSELLLISSPLFPVVFGKGIDKALEHCFVRTSNVFSHEYVSIAEVDGKAAGMLLGYSWQKKYEHTFITGWMLIMELGISVVERIPAIIESGRVSGTVNEGEYYISNVATLPDFRGMGVGSALLAHAEKLALGCGANTIALEVDRKNAGALRLYKKSGYEVQKEFSIDIDGRKSFYRMIKKL